MECPLLLVLRKEEEERGGGWRSLNLRGLKYGYGCCCWAPSTEEELSLILCMEAKSDLGAFGHEPFSLNMV